ncbi:GNAT family N-acetyltransferase [Micromonospora endolithica]|uniref:GNAT family N-acetyltransferase n=1 Tax=Micromonospora endolithica TaxID=230091 RepID=A0A3A9ZJV7_9ACTN|nr:GNAT family N-acetyltransferase [Micromonospora endolithica]RKN48590.1 GNAT family N-acetyltransferase [Micromonospora endolithica]TWJ22079.1 L-amino acid N-acyltransferase YncA [Micromonospora endolithica]
MQEVELTVRPASLADVPSLVELRLANAQAHLALDPGIYRIPQREAVVCHFTAMLADEPGRDAVLVAEAHDGRAVGMIEVLRQSDPPEHQILRPEPSAQVHTVVLPDARGLGVGSALLKAACRWATDRGIIYLSAGIYHRNIDAVRFYRRHGYTNAGFSLGRRLD